MSEEKERPKNKEKRFEQKERVDAETQRSLSVAEMKKAHMLIEETEKSRKRPILLSICSRIEYHIKLLVSSMEMLGMPSFALNKILSDNILDDLNDLAQGYESIRFDFQRSMEIKEEEMNKLFPNIRIDLTSGYNAASTLSRMTRQLVHMKLYCERMLRC